MNTPEEERVLVWAPRGRDAALAVDMLEHHGLLAQECRTVDEVIAGVSWAGCAIMVVEHIDPVVRVRLLEALANQPLWSDFPIVLFAPGGDRGADAIEASKMLGNVTLLERPVHVRTLISAVVAALRGRRRQYEARQAIRSRDQFLAMLGHELRNPLAAIVLALDMLHAVSGDLGAKQRTIIDRQVRHLSRLVDDLLDVARVTSGKITLHHERVDLAEVVRRCIAGADLAARRGSITLTMAPVSGPLVVEGDLVRLEEVFNNLIGNAIKYSPEHARVEVIARNEGNEHVVDVVDTGIGMAPDVLANVFDLFAQADTSLDRSQGGLGIGLTLVRSLVELHRGRVDAHSEGLGRGSRFTVRLPALEARVAPKLVSVPAQPLSARVAVIDDNVDLLDMTKDLLEANGCKVRTANDGHNGLALLLAEAFDIAFVDIGLPGMDGLQLAAQLRAQATAQPYLVAMSGYGQPEDRARALAAGFDEHIIKPVTLETLRRALRASEQTVRARALR